MPSPLVDEALAISLSVLATLLATLTIALIVVATALSTLATPLFPRPRTHSRTLPQTLIANASSSSSYQS
jgi:hypothetical protein